MVSEQQVGAGLEKKIGELSFITSSVPFHG